MWDRACWQTSEYARRRPWRRWRRSAPRTSPEAARSSENYMLVQDAIVDVLRYGNHAGMLILLGEGDGASDVRGHGADGGSHHTEDIDYSVLDQHVILAG